MKTILLSALCAVLTLACERGALDKIELVTENREVESSGGAALPATPEPEANPFELEVGMLEDRVAAFQEAVQVRSQTVPTALDEAQAKVEEAEAVLAAATNYDEIKSRTNDVQAFITDRGTLLGNELVNNQVQQEDWQTLSDSMTRLADRVSLSVDHPGRDLNLVRLSTAENLLVQLNDELSAIEQFLSLYETRIQDYRQALNEALGQPYISNNFAYNAANNTHYQSLCPQNSLTAFSGRADGLIDQLQVVCGNQQGQAVGGVGGDPFGPLSCPSGTVAKGIRGTMEDALDSLGLVCVKAQQIDQSEQLEFSPLIIGNLQSDQNFMRICPARRIVTGLQGTIDFGFSAGVIRTIEIVCTAQP
ncbi:hypothetical protein [Pseudobacteriovorax antillogorgiicola]|uniref:Uncharacterized protein n=1 Tax=Pseudobacteriovorax antillogorgiicola TaxID=1513793 RepID=A0A1Y6BGT6_9BACT|nr:hypothetical protein [Pseudobacteriovorax antillogorgiicola]TCS57274.1 hypothetical protein EDD56_10314 [Pseudobacteriovorax antillogorgiicola]SMF03195.1 hypothetical protein SAMN06296036_103319 [Pseudobacteriovorax antillogorgiicola]